HRRIQHKRFLLRGRRIVRCGLGHVRFSGAGEGGFEIDRIGRGGFHPNLERRRLAAVQSVRVYRMHARKDLLRWCVGKRGAHRGEVLVVAAKVADLAADKKDWRRAVESALDREVVEFKAVYVYVEAEGGIGAGRAGP